MNGEPRTDLIQLITRTESLSGDDDLAPARPTLIRRPLRDFRGVILVRVFFARARLTESAYFLRPDVQLRITPEA